MKLSEAASRGITRVRRPIWANPGAYLRLSFRNGMREAVSKLFDRVDQEFFGLPTPQGVFALFDQCDDFVPYDGPLDPADDCPGDGVDANQTIYLVRELYYDSISGNTLLNRFAAYRTAEEAEAAIALMRNSSSHVFYWTTQAKLRQWVWVNPYSSDGGE